MISSNPPLILLTSRIDPRRRRDIMTDVMGAVLAKTITGQGHQSVQFVADALPTVRTCQPHCRAVLSRNLNSPSLSRASLQPFTARPTGKGKHRTRVQGRQAGLDSSLLASSGPTGRGWPAVIGSISAVCGPSPNRLRAAVSRRILPSLRMTGGPPMSDAAPPRPDPWTTAPIIEVPAAQQAPKRKRCWLLPTSSASAHSCLGSASAPPSTPEQPRQLSPTSPGNRRQPSQRRPPSQSTSPS
jgi:hypothetical protein